MEYRLPFGKLQPQQTEVRKAQTPHRPFRSAGDSFFPDIMFLRLTSRMIGKHGKQGNTATESWSALGPLHEGRYRASVPRQASLVHLVPLPSDAALLFNNPEHIFLSSLFFFISSSDKFILEGRKKSFGHCYLSLPPSPLIQSRVRYMPLMWLEQD